MLPSEILEIQHWFAGIITQPLDNPIEDAEEYIAPSSKLSSAQRIQIYNQQYWWRLLTILQQNFPTLTRLFGYTDFNKTLGVPFLSKHLSRHWSLSKLGEEMPRWIEQQYHENDKLLVQNIAELDWAYLDLFFAPAPIALEASLDLLTKKLQLQKHVKLFSFPFDLLTYRKELLKENVEFWADADFPSLPKGKYYFLLWRRADNQIAYREIEEGQWTLLHLIVEGKTIEDASETLERRGGLLYEQAISSFQDWIQEWIREKLLQEIKDGTD